MTILHRGVFMILPSKQIHLQDYVLESKDDMLSVIDQALVTLAVRRAELLGSIHPQPTSDLRIDTHEHG